MGKGRGERETLPGPADSHLPEGQLRQDTVQVTPRAASSGQKSMCRGERAPYAALGVNRE